MQFNHENIIIKVCYNFMSFMQIINTIQIYNIMYYYYFTAVPCYTRISDQIIYLLERWK